MKFPHNGMGMEDLLDEVRDLTDQAVNDAQRIAELERQVTEVDNEWRQEFARLVRESNTNYREVAEQRDRAAQGMSDAIDLARGWRDEYQRIRNLYVSPERTYVNSTHALVVRWLDVWRRRRSEVPYSGETS